MRPILYATIYVVTSFPCPACHCPACLSLVSRRGFPLVFLPPPVLFNMIHIIKKLELKLAL